MDRLRFLLTSSIGKKNLMAVTGLLFIAYLVIHLVGNLNIYLGAEKFQAWANMLHSMGGLVIVFNIGLLTIGVIHIVYAMTLIVQNMAARPVDYAGKKAEGGRSLGSRTMIFTGPLILLFVVFHLVQFTFVDKSSIGISQIVKMRFADPAWVGFYAVSMLFVGLHIGHGFWSALQTLGLESLRRGAMRQFSTLLSWAFGVGFGLLPVVVHLFGDKIKF